MAHTVENLTDLLIKLSVDGVEYLIKKDYLTVGYSGDYVHIRWHELESNRSRYFFQLDYNDFTSPIEASASDLADRIESWMIPAGTGGGGTTSNVLIDCGAYLTPNENVLIECGTYI